MIASGEIRLAKASDIPPFSVTITDIIEVEPIAEAHPNVRHLHSLILLVPSSILTQTAIMSRQVLFTEKPKPDRQSPDKTATKTLLKTLILEAWNELA
jgi:hypothetical protein